MKLFSQRNGLGLVFTSMMLMTSLAVAAPPFVKGQIAVYAAQHEIEDLEVVKYLPHSGISVISVQSGKEWGQVQKFRKRGLKAGLNYIAQASVTADITNMLNAPPIQAAMMVGFRP